jgi:regulator of sigma D
MNTAESEIDTSSRWYTMDDMLQRWLQERQSLILLLCAVDGLKTYTPKSTPLKIKLNAFCQILVDYVSAGHFEVYQRLLEEAALHGIDATIHLDNYLPIIHESTDLAIQFNDKFDAIEDLEASQQELCDDMSVLAEYMEERFEAEDAMIEVLHTCFKPQVKAS